MKNLSFSLILVMVGSSMDSSSGGKGISETDFVFIVPQVDVEASYESEEP